MLKKILFVLKIVLKYHLKNIRLDEVKYYYNSHDSFQPLDYDKAKVHVLKNNKFELRIYYFKGLNQISIDMQSEAMKKLNNKDNKNKVYRLK